MPLLKSLLDIEIKKIIKKTHIYTHIHPQNGYLGLSVDLRLIFQQEIDHLHIAIVTGHMERSVSQLMIQKIISKM